MKRKGKKQIIVLQLLIAVLLALSVSCSSDVEGEVTPPGVTPPTEPGLPVPSIADIGFEVEEVESFIEKFIPYNMSLTSFWYDLDRYNVDSLGDEEVTGDWDVWYTIGGVSDPENNSISARISYGKKPQYYNNGPKGLEVSEEFTAGGINFRKYHDPNNPDDESVSSTYPIYIGMIIDPSSDEEYMLQINFIGFHSDAYSNFTDYLIQTLNSQKKGNLSRSSTLNHLKESVDELSLFETCKNIIVEDRFYAGRNMLRWHYICDEKSYTIELDLNPSYQGESWKCCIGGNTGYRGVETTIDDYQACYASGGSYSHGEYRIKARLGSKTLTVTVTVDEKSQAETIIKAIDLDEGISMKHEECAFMPL